MAALEADKGHQEDGPQDPKRPLSHSDLVAALNSDNVETLFGGLSSFNRALLRLVREEVDAEVSGETELVQDYIKGSPECAELFRIWEFQQNNQIDKLETVIFDVLAHIIPVLKMTGHRSSGTAIVRNIIRNHMKAIYRNLSSGKYTVIQSTLRLMVSIAGYTQSTTRELQETFNFTMKPLHKLLSVRKRANEEKKSSRPTEDVRTLYIRFILAFLVRGDTGVKKAVLETKDFVSGIFKGMIEDFYETVDFILSTLRSRIIDDQYLGRSVKVSFFNNYVLEQLLRLYVRSDASRTGAASADGSSTVADKIHEFMLHLCTQPGIGLCFHDLGWYPPSATGDKKSNKIYNTTLLRLLGMLRPTEDARQEALTLGILTSCPELVVPFWQSSVNLSFEPRLSSRWLANVALAAKIIRLPVPSRLGATSAQMSPPSISVMAENILPTPLSRAVTGRALQHSSPLIKYTAAGVLSLASEKLADLRRVLEGMEQGSSGPDRWRNCWSNLLDEIRRRMPELQIVLALQQPVTARPANADTVQVHVKGDDEGDAQAKETEKEITPELLQGAALRLLTHYQRHFPTAVLESRFDHSKLIPADVMVLPTELQWHLLNLVGEVRDFKWWAKPAGSTQRSHLFTILHLHFSTTDTSLSTLTTRVIRHLLSQSFLFGHHADEISIYLNALRLLPPSHRTTAIQWLDEALCAGVKSPYRLVDRLSEAVEGARKGMDEEGVRVVDHLVASRSSVVGSGGDAMNIDTDGAQSPVGPAILCAFDGAVAVVKRAKEGKAGVGEDDVRDVMKALFFVVLGLVNLTQGVGDIVSEIVRRCAENEDISGSEFGSAGEFVEAMKTYCRRYGSSQTSLHRNGVKSDEMDVDLSLKSIGLREKSSKIEKFTRFLDQNCSPTAFASVHAVAFSIAASHSSFINPISAFLTRHHPVLGSIFDVYDSFRELTSEESLDEDNMAIRILSNLHPMVVIANVFEYASQLDTTLPTSLRALLQQRLEATSWRDWIGLTRQALLETTCAVHAATSLKESVMETAMWVIQFLLSRARATFLGGESLPQEDVGDVGAEVEFRRVYAVIRETVFKHPIIVDGFLSETSEILSSAVFNLVHDTITQERSSIPTTRQPLPSIWPIYTDRILSRAHHDLSSPSSTPSPTVIRAFSTFRSFLAPEDLNHIITQLFESPVISDAHDQMLTVALTGGDQASVRGAVGRKIGMKSFGKLLMLMRNRPSEDIDAIVLRTVEAAYVPNALLGGEESGGDVVRVVVDDEERGHGDKLDALYADVASLVDEETMRFLVTNPTGTRARIARILVEASPVHRIWVIDWVGEAGKQVDRDLAVMLLDGLVMALSTVKDGSAEWVGSVTEKEMEAAKVLHKRVKKNLVAALVEFTGEEREVFRIGDERGVGFALRLTGLFRKSYTASLLNDVIEHLHATTESSPKWATACAWAHQYMGSFDNIARHAEDGVQSLQSLILICLKLLREVYAQQKKNVEENKTVFAGLVGDWLRILGGLSDEKKTEVVESILRDDHGKEVIKSYIQTTLRYRLVDPAALEGLVAVVQLLYAKETNAARSLLPFELPTLIDMIMTHSQSAKILLPQSDASAVEGEKKAEKGATHLRSFHPAKYQLVRLLESIMSVDPVHCCKTSHIPLLVAAYQGTVAASDRIILRIWNHFEVGAGVSVADWVGNWNGAGVVGGDEGDEVAGGVVVTAVNIFDALNAVDPVWMAGSIQNFDPYAPFEQPQPSVTSTSPKTSRHSPTYDPSFFLPLLITILSRVTDTTQFDTRRIVESNLLGLAVMSLSSTDIITRKAAYCALDWAYQAIQDGDFKERTQVLLLLDGVRNAVVNREDEWSEEGGIAREKKKEEDGDKVPQRVPSVVALFAAQALMVLLKPEGDMFMSINRFLLQRPVVDFKDVPLFYDLFYSPSPDCRRERIWMLRLLSCGLKAPADYALYKRRHVFDILMGFFPSPLADTMSRKLIFEIIFKASFISSVLVDMIKHSGLLTFLSSLSATLDFTPNNDLALALPSLCTRVLNGWLKTDPEWFGRNGEGRKVWMDVFANVCLGLVNSVSGRILDGGAYDNGKKEKGKMKEKEKWWSRVVLDVVEFVRCVVKGFEVVHGIVGLAPFGIEVFDTLRRVIVLSLDRLADEGDAGSEVGSSRDELDLDSLYVVKGSSKAQLEAARARLVQVLISVNLVLPERPTVQDGDNRGPIVGNILGWTATCIYEFRDVWEAEGTIEKFLVWLRRMLDSPATILRVPNTCALGNVRTDLVRVLCLLSARVGAVGARDERNRLSALAVGSLILLSDGMIENGGKKRKRKDDEDYEGKACEL
ncbi:nucleolar pre-ribosomal-associated protein 1 [Rhizophlyctis rosea]|nr:nucleolar pre-ribosomal-associated protein 1 [Rhizophlyctis rosea]